MSRDRTREPQMAKADGSLDPTGRWFVDTRNTNAYLLCNDGIVAGFSGQFQLEHQNELWEIADAHNESLAALGRGETPLGQLHSTEDTARIEQIIASVGRGVETMPPTAGSVLVQTLDFTLSMLADINTAMEAKKLYEAGEAFAELREALQRQRAALGEYK